jgi:hypothetical protein
MIRLLDIIISFFGLVFFFPIFFLLFLGAWFETGSPFFFQKRVGINLNAFILIKIRTMKLNTVSKATHLVSSSSITTLGYFFRKLNLDEIPQLFNVIIGNMSLVGPRPCLFNQKRLIRERKKRGIFKVKPGVTGLAQILGITMAKPKLLAKTDLKMIKQMSLFYYFYYILKTALIAFKKKN